MKTTAIITRCLPAARSSMRRDARHAHIPHRRAVAGRIAGDDAAPSLSYTEAAHSPVRRERQPQGSSARPRVLHLDADPAAAAGLASLLKADAEVMHAATLAEARRLLQDNVFSLLVVDPSLPDGDVRTLLPMLTGTLLLIYSAHHPEWRGVDAAFLPKAWTGPRQLWTAISTMLGTSPGISAGA